MMSRLSVVAPIAMLGGGLTAAPSIAQAPDDKVVPVHEEPRHRLVFDSPGARILDIQIPPGDTTLFHTHSHPILYVNMSSSQTRSQTLGQEWSGGATARPAPAAAPPAAPRRMNSVTSYAQQPLTHRVNNVGQTLFHLIGITNHSTGDANTAPSADFAATPEVDNRWFRGYRWTLSDAAPAEHRHANPVALVLIAGRGAVAAATETALETPGAFAVVEANVPHRVRAAGSAEIVEVEIRQPRP